MVEIIDYAPAYAADFKRLNLEWLQQYFSVEPQDEEMLSHPEYITGNGGFIFLAKYNHEIAGTVALVRHDDILFELSKMSVTASLQGKGISNLLMQAVIDKAATIGASRLILYSNTILIPAIRLYRKFGFTEIPLEENSGYVRNNIKMELSIR